MEMNSPDFIIDLQSLRKEILKDDPEAVFTDRVTVTGLPAHPGLALRWEFEIGLKNRKESFEVSGLAKFNHIFEVIKEISKNECVVRFGYRCACPNPDCVTKFVMSRLFRIRLVAKTADSESVDGSSILSSGTK
jgi:hypothetical protein